MADLPSGYQLRAARSLIGRSQADLAKASEVDHTTIARLEKAGHGPVPRQSRKLQAIISALRKAGVEFIEAGVAANTKAPALTA
jgi:predicted transcriptional regulator